ncbi:MAG: hypothetical protein ACKVVP_23475 [Chloroflexota bacterium]
MLSIGQGQASGRGDRVLPGAEVVDSGEQHGSIVQGYARRLLGLLVIGFTPAVLLYTRDIRVTYAILGIVLFLFRDMSS